jgi:hypothetical protein
VVQLPLEPLDVRLHLLELVLDGDHVGHRPGPVEQPEIDPLLGPPGGELAVEVDDPT